MWEALCTPPSWSPNLHSRAFGASLYAAGCYLARVRAVILESLRKLAGNSRVFSFSIVAQSHPALVEHPNLTTNNVISKGTRFPICISRCLLKMWPLEGAILSGGSLSPGLAVGGRAGCRRPRVLSAVHQAARGAALGGRFPGAVQEAGRPRSRKAQGAALPEEGWQHVRWAPAQCPDVFSVSCLHSFISSPQLSGMLNP